MALPNEADRPHSPPQRWRIAIGHIYEKDGRRLPAKADHFTIRRLTYQSGTSPTYVVDDEMQAAMCSAAGVREKPTTIPVSVIGNPSLDAAGQPILPQSMLFAEMAHYSGGKRVCWCGEFDADGCGTATKRTYQERTTKDGKRKYKTLAQEEQITCNPATCPLATGAHDQTKYEGVSLCKPHVIATMTLPWAPSVGASAKFRTTGWHSYHAMRASLLQVALQTRGWLHELPLQLTLDWRMANGQLVPEVRFEYVGTVAQLRGQSIEVRQLWTGQEATIKQLEAGIVEETEAVIGDEREQEATQDEFWPEAGNGRARRLVVPPTAPVIRPAAAAAVPDETAPEPDLPEGTAEGEFEPQEPDAAPPEDFGAEPEAPLPFPELSAHAKQVTDWFQHIGAIEEGRGILASARQTVGAKAPDDVLARELARRANVWWQQEGHLTYKLAGGEVSG